MVCCRQLTVIIVGSNRLVATFVLALRPRASVIIYIVEAAQLGGFRPESRLPGSLSSLLIGLLDVLSLV